MEERINKAELSRRLNKSPPYISKLIKQKKLIFDSDGLITYKNAINQINQNAERISNTLVNTKVNTKDVNTENNSEENFDYKHYKTISEKWKSKQEELNYEEQKKNLISKFELEQEAYAIGNLLKEQFLSMPERLCNIFAAEGDPSVIRKEWIKETKRILEEIAKKIEEVKE